MRIIYVGIRCSKQKGRKVSLKLDTVSESRSEKLTTGNLANEESV